MYSYSTAKAAESYTIYIISVNMFTSNTKGQVYSVLCIDLGGVVLLNGDSFLFYSTHKGEHKNKRVS